MSEERQHPEYPSSKGMQIPFELLGFRGHYIAWAIGVAVLVIIVLVVCMAFLSGLYGFLAVIVTAAIGFGYTFYRQSIGLYTKDKKKGVFVISHFNSY